MRSYAVVVCGRLLGLLVPRLPAATSDSQRITMLGDATRRQEEEISPEGEQHREGLPRVPRDVRRDSVHPLAGAGDPAREKRRPEPRGEVMHVKPARLVAKGRQQMRPLVQEYAI